MTDGIVAHAQAWDGEAAARGYFGAGPRRLACGSLDAVHAAVARGDCAYGVLPLECSSEGMVNRSHDLLYAGGVRVVGEWLHPSGCASSRSDGGACLRHAIIAPPSHPTHAQDDRLMVAVVLPRHTGSLLDLLAPLALRQLSVEHWCSRPARVEGWHYRFHFTLAADSGLEAVELALQEAAARCHELRVLGRFRGARRSHAPPAPQHREPPDPHSPCR